MVCSVCSTVNTDDAAECVNCKTPFDPRTAEPTELLEPPPLATAATVAMGGIRSFTTTGLGDFVQVTEDSVLGGRYQIVKLLGEGGMGAVYKAIDRELERIVALKVIRPQFANEPGVLQRFKQELVLARQVTNRNVIRIFDLGTAGGVRFITMEYIDGRDLSSILKEKHKLSPEEAVSYLIQVCAGLTAAHTEGVIHRDLKPTNIMIDAHGRAIIMDFGIARSMSSSRLTRTGALMGTPVYMSPEQAKAEPLDARSDIYTLGIIFYELLTGTVPFKADTTMAMLLKRCQEKPVPPIEVDPSISPTLNDIILKAMATNPADRYQSAREMLEDLEIYHAGSGFTPVSGVLPRILSGRPPEPPSRLRRIANVALSIVAAVSLSAALYMGYKSSHSAGGSAARKSVTVLVGDFDNTTSESVFDGTLEPVFMAGMEGVSFVDLFNRSTAHTLAEELKPGSSRLNEAMARSIATREGINVVLTGLIARQGDGYRVSVSAIDGPTGKTIDSRDSPVVKKDEVIVATTKMVPKLRRAIGDVTPESQQMASGETFTSTSLDALHDYGAAQQQQWVGNFTEASKLYLAAVKADPKFGRAYAGLAAISRNLGQSAEAESYYKKALELTEFMTEREKLRTRGGYFLFMKDPKAATEFADLVKLYPTDTAGQANLAVAYCYSRDMTKAMEEGRKATKLEPKNIIRRFNFADYALYASDTATAAAEARAVLSANPKYLKAYVVLALAQILDGQNDEAAKTYKQLQAVSPLGGSMASTGLADLAMYEGRFSEAASILERGIEADSADPKADSAIAKHLMLAESLLKQKKITPAVERVNKALAISRSDPVLFSAARIFIDAGQDERARGLRDELSKRTLPEPRAYARLILAKLLLAQQKTAEAIDGLTDAQKSTDTWIGHLELGRAYLTAGAGVDADSEIDKCLKRRGEATSLFLDEVPTARYLPDVYLYQGLALEKLGGDGNPRAVAAFQKFLALKLDSQPDSLIDLARARVANGSKGK